MKRRSLWPREHGAYFQLAIPLLTACVVRSPTVASIALCAGAALAFLANEPLLVVLGHRGPRRKAIDGPAARIRLALLAGTALGLGVFGLALAPHAIAGAAIVAVPTLALVGFAWRRAEHTLAGELIAAIALTGASVPVLVASGASLAFATEVWLAWGLGFGATVLAVHRVIERHRGAADLADLGLAAALVVLAFGAISGWAPLVFATPLVGISAVLVIAPPPASRLRAIGVTIAVASIGGSALVLAAS